MRGSNPISRRAGSCRGSDTFYTRRGGVCGGSSTSGLLSLGADPVDPAHLVPVPSMAGKEEVLAIWRHIGSELGTLGVDTCAQVSRFRPQTIRISETHVQVVPAMAVLPSREADNQIAFVGGDEGILVGLGELTGSPRPSASPYFPSRFSDL